MIHGMRWTTTRFELDLSMPRLMGIVNLTPDSFSDGGQFETTDHALRHCETLLAEGADILDLGAESSRPGATAVAADDEWSRLEPVLRHAVTLGKPISVDTRKPEVMERALDLGADIINDVMALRAPGALELLARHPRAGVCLMHMQNDPATMQAQPDYQDVVHEVMGFLAQRVAACLSVGMAPDRIVIDPGIGFGKTVEHNLALLQRQRELLALRCPLLVGWSRKSTIGHLTGRPAGERMVGSVVAAVAALAAGARIVRVHDVAATADAVRVAMAAGLIPGTGTAAGADNMG
jgi:dihydropteroate synthase